MWLKINFTWCGRCWRHYVRAILNPYLLGEVRLHDDAYVKEALNKILWENNWYLNYLCLTFKKLCNFVESQGFFLHPLVMDLNLLPHEWWIWLELVDAHLHPLSIAFWHKCVLHHCVSEIEVHIHLSITKCEIG